MIIQPKVRGFICTTAHPVGCEANVVDQTNYVLQKDRIAGCKNILVIGSSTGYGLASRIVASFSCGANTLGVCFEKPAGGKRTASAGWYNTAAFEKLAGDHGQFAATINGDAFSTEIKQQTIELIKEKMGTIDCVIYSLASPKRVDPSSGEVYSSALKTVGEPFHSLSVDPIKGSLSHVDVEPASEDEIASTVKVMGGEDWQLWMDALLDAEVLSHNVITLAYSYVGPELTYPIYREGTIGYAKKDLEKTAASIQDDLAQLEGHAYISVNKAVVTQASSAIPVVPLYMSILFKVMKEKNLHEGCIEQIYRLFSEKIYGDHGVVTDDLGLVRIDDWEMHPDVQAEVAQIWEAIDQDNLHALSDLQCYQNSFYQLFGFHLGEIDYDKDVEANVPIPSIELCKTT